MLNNTVNVSVRYSETDQLKVVYYSRYFEYFEIGRRSLLTAYGFPYSEMESKFNCYLPVLDTYAKFIKPAKLEDEITVVSKVLEKPSVRIRFDHEILCGEKLLVTGYVTCVFFDGITSRPSQPPNKLLELFNAHFRINEE